MSIFRKAICLILSLLVLLSCVVITSSAAEEGLSDYPAADGFSNFIDVDEYRSKAGEPGYDELKLVGISAPILTVEDDEGTQEKVYRYRLDFYIYNPMLLTIREHARNYTGGSVGSLSLTDPWHTEKYIRDFYVSYSESYENDSDYVTEDYENYYRYISGQMFYCLSFSGLYDPEQTDLYEWSFYFDTLRLNIGQSDVAEFSIRQSMKFESTETALETSSPVADLARFLRTDEHEVSFQDVRDMYPLYENGGMDAIFDQVFIYPTDNYIWLYLYHSYGRFDGVETVDASLCFFGSRYFNFTLDVICYEGSLLKCRMSRPSVLNTSLKVKDVTYRYHGLTVKDDMSCTYTFDYIYPVESYSLVGQDVLVSSGGGLVNTRETAVQVSFVSQEIVLNDLKTTYYRLNSSVSGGNYYPTLESVYFSVPKYFFEMDEADKVNNRKIEYIKGQYKWAMTIPALLYEDGGSFAGYCKDISRHEYEWSHIYFLANPLQSPQGIRGADYAFYKEFDYLAGTDAYKYFNAPLFMLNVPELPDGFELVMSRSDFEEYLKKFDHPYQGDLNLVDFEINKDDTLDLLSMSELTNWQRFLANGSLKSLFGWDEDDLDDSIKNISPIVVLDDNEKDGISYYLNMSDSELINALHVAEEDVSAIRSKMESAKQKDELFVLFRFDVYDYYATKDVYTQRRGYAYHDDVLVFCDKYYQDFAIGEMKLSNNGEAVVYQVSMTPISFVGGGVFSVPDPDNVLPPIGDWFPSIQKKASSFWDVFQRIVSIVLFVSLGLVLIVPVSKIVVLAVRGIQNVSHSIREKKNKNRKE